MNRFRLIGLGDVDLGTIEADPTTGGLIDHNGDSYLVLQVDKDAKLIRVAQVDGKRAHEIYMAIMDTVVNKFSGPEYRLRDAVNAMLHLAATISDQNNHSPESKSDCAAAFLEMAHAHCVTVFGLAAAIRATADIHRRTIEEGLHFQGPPPTA